MDVVPTPGTHGNGKDSRIGRTRRVLSSNSRLSSHPGCEGGTPMILMICIANTVQSQFRENQAQCSNADYDTGDVVRYAPNELSFGTFQSAKDIYGHASKGSKPFRKGLWYTSFMSKGETAGLATETDPEVHRQTRKNLSNAFSAQALGQQTPLIMEYIDLFVAQVAKHGNTERGIPVDDWFMWLAFDVVGDLAFGESFQAVANGESNDSSPCTLLVG